MEFDFETILDRVGKDAMAVERIPVRGAEVNPGVSKIPMWIADMNFATAPSITEALQKRIEHPAFGYFATTDEYYEAIISWQKRRLGVELEKEYIGYENGVLGGLVSALRAFASPGDKVLVHSPTYIGFTGSIEGCGMKVVSSPLVMDEDGIWRMDYEDMDKKLKENKIHVAVFCSPHNPCGRVWEREELEKALEVYAANDCVVICDEIWSDLVLRGKHIPLQSVNDDAKKRVIALYAPSKTFNLAGLIGAYHVVYDSYLHDRLNKAAELTHYNSMNVLSMHALIGAYSDVGERWLEELLITLRKNVDYGYNFITENFPGVKLAKPEGSYMFYLDCDEYCKNSGRSIDEVLKAGVAAGVIWQDGRPFKLNNSIRMNLAVPYSLVVEAFDRLKKYAFV